MDQSAELFLTDAEAARFLRQSLVTNWRYRKARTIADKLPTNRTKAESMFLEDWISKHSAEDYRGPRFRRRGRRIFYLKSDLISWISGIPDTQFSLVANDEEPNRG